MEKEPWELKEFFTSNGVATFLSSLPRERALEAKVTVTDVSGRFYVFYQAAGPGEE